jgi:uncharacterized membrane protein YccC
MPDEGHVQISMHHIPIRGGIGAALLIAVLIAVMLIELPQLRWPVIGSAAAGIVLGAALVVWRWREGLSGADAPLHRTLPLHL